MWATLLRDRQFQLATGVLVLIVLVGIVGPGFVQDPSRFLGLPNHPPSARFLLGTDAFGRDVLARFVVGIRTSLLIGAYAGLIATLIAVVVGAVGAYIGGLIGEGADLLTNIVMMFPVLPLLIILSAVLEVRSIWLVGTMIALVSWPWAARCIRSQVLSLREREFVRLARISGDGRAKVALLEVMPNMLAYVVMVLVIIIGGAIMAEAGISMIGLGPTDVISLGNLLYWSLLHEATRVGHWWTFVPPGVVLTLFTTFSLIMHARMDHVFNPRLRTW